MILVCKCRLFLSVCSIFESLLLQLGVQLSFLSLNYFESVLKMASSWKEQADFPSKWGGGSRLRIMHDTFNCNSNRSLFKLCCTRCLNLKHVLTFVHDDIGTFKASDIAMSFIKLFSSKKDFLREVTRLIEKTLLSIIDASWRICLRFLNIGQFGLALLYNLKMRLNFFFYQSFELRLYSFDSHLTRCLSGRQQTDGQCGFRITLVENQRA